jgi:hypothetical protein
MTQRFEIHRKRQLAVEYGLDKVRRQKAQAQDPHDVVAGKSNLPY